MARIVTLCVIWYILGFTASLPFPIAYPGGYNYGYGEPQLQNYQTYPVNQQNRVQPQYVNPASSSAIIGNTYPNLQLPNQQQHAAFLNAPQKESYQNVLGPATPSQEQIQAQIATGIVKQQSIPALNNQLASSKTVSANHLAGIAESYLDNQVPSINIPAPQLSQAAVAEDKVQTEPAQENVKNPFAQLYQDVVQRPEQNIDAEFLQSWKQRLPVPEAQKPYLVIHPDGRTEYVDKIETIKEKYPNFRLLNVGQSPSTSNLPQAPLSNVQQSNVQSVTAQLVNQPKIQVSQSQLDPKKIDQQNVAQNVSPTPIKLLQTNLQIKPENLQSNVQTVPQLQPQSIASQVLSSSVQPAQQSDSAAQQYLIPNGQTVPQIQQNSGPQNPLSSVLLNSTSIKPEQQSVTLEQHSPPSNINTVSQTHPVEQPPNSGPQNPLASTLLNSTSTQPIRKPENVPQKTPQIAPQSIPQPVDQPSNKGPQNPLASVLLNSTAPQSVPVAKEATLSNKEKVPQAQPQTFDQISNAGQQNPSVKHSVPVAQQTSTQSVAAPVNDNLSNSKVKSNKNAKFERESQNNQKTSSSSAEIGSTDSFSVNKKSLQSQKNQQVSNQNQKPQTSNKIDNTSTEDNETASQSTSNKDEQQSPLESVHKQRKLNEQENQSKPDNSVQKLPNSQTDEADKQEQPESKEQLQPQSDNQTDDKAKQPNPQTSKLTKEPKSKHLNNPDDVIPKKSNTGINKSLSKSGEIPALENSLPENTSKTEPVSSKPSGKVIVIDTTNGDIDSHILSNLIGDNPYSIIQFFLVKPERTIERNVTRMAIDEHHYLEEITQSDTYGDGEPVITSEKHLVSAS